MKPQNHHKILQKTYHQTIPNQFIYFYDFIMIECLVHVHQHGFIPIKYQQFAAALQYFHLIHLFSFLVQKFFRFVLTVQNLRILHHLNHCLLGYIYHKLRVFTVSFLILFYQVILQVLIFLLQLVQVSHLLYICDQTLNHLHQEYYLCVRNLIFISRLDFLGLKIMTFHLHLLFHVQKIQVSLYFLIVIDYYP